MLGYLEKLTLCPQEIEASDVAVLKAAGISQEAMRDAIYVCFIFNVIDRLADALDFRLLPDYTSHAQGLLKQGYRP